MANEDQDELDRLRARVYGRPTAGGISESDINRLAKLESGRSTNAASSSTPRPERNEPVVVDPSPHAPGVTVGTGRFRLRRVAAVAVAAAACVAAFIGGIFLGGLHAENTETTFPEFGYTQTEADNATPDWRSLTPAVFAQRFVDVGVSPDTIRHVATVDEIAIFLARPGDSPSVCVVTAPVSTLELASTCSPTAVLASPRSDFWVSAGPVSDQDLAANIPPGLQPRQVSESVSVYTRP